MTDSRVPHRRYGLMSMSRDRVTTVTNSGQSARIETTHICTETLPPVGDTSSGKPPLDCHPEICSDFAHSTLQQPGDAATLAGCGRRTSSCGSSKPTSGVSIRVDACAAASRVHRGVEISAMGQGQLCHQVGGTAGVPSAPELLCTPRQFRLVPKH